MYVRISPGSFDPSRENEVRISENTVIPALQGLPGFQSYQGAIDRNAGRLVTITTWDTEEHARFSRDQIADTMSQIQGAGIQLEPAQVYEVTAQA